MLFPFLIPHIFFCQKNCATFNNLLIGISLFNSSVKLVLHLMLFHILIFFDNIYFPLLIRMQNEKQILYNGTKESKYSECYLFNVTMLMLSITLQRCTSLHCYMEYKTFQNVVRKRGT